MKHHPKIAIIGAGIAGLSCATALKAAGVTPTVLDKSRGPAGRMSTRRGDGWQCDHGAQYFTARDPDFRAEVARWQQAGVAAPWPARIAVLGDGRMRSDEIPPERFVGAPRMTAPARFLADDLPLTLQTTVTELRPSPDGWWLVSAEHGLHPTRFDAVLLAVPAPQAVPLLRDPAPGLASLAARANMRGSWALMLRYDTPIHFPFDAAFVNSGPLRWIARDSSKPGRPGGETWLLHATAAWSEAHIEDAPDVIADVLLRAFAELGAPPPQAWTAHRWRYADTEPPLDACDVWDVDRRVGLCGDWLNGGKVEGAWLGGRSLAQDVLQHFGYA